MRFVGIDLAWSKLHTDRAETGGVALSDKGVVLESALADTDDSILGFVLRHTDADGCVVAIDAPLVVPNEEGQRPCEGELQAAGVSCYPANRSLFECVHGGVRGEDLVALLGEHGYQLRDHIEPGKPMKAVVEVYPRALLKRYWGSVPPYKGSKVRGDLRAQGLRELQRRMLTRLEPPLRWPDPPVGEGYIRGDLKRLADLLDAALSAYIAYIAWLPGPSRTETVGSLEAGFILLPKKRA